jgi:thiamine monophosphate synthase
MKRHAFDLGVYLVTDRAWRSAAWKVVRAAIENGATLVQLRDKHVDARCWLGRCLRCCAPPGRAHRQRPIDVAGVVPRACT